MVQKSRLIACLVAVSALAMMANADGQDIQLDRTLMAYKAYAEQVEITTDPIVELTEDPRRWAQTFGNRIEFLGSVTDEGLDPARASDLLAFEDLNNNTIMLFKGGRPLAYAPVIDRSSPVGYCMDVLKEIGAISPDDPMMTDREFMVSFLYANSAAIRTKSSPQTVCIQSTGPGLANPYFTPSTPGGSAVPAQSADPTVKMTGQGLGVPWVENAANGTASSVVASGSPDVPLLNVFWSQEELGLYNGWGTVSLFWQGYPNFGDGHSPNGGEPLIYDRSPGWTDCSGVIVSPKHVLTAAHCVCREAHARQAFNAYEVIGNNMNLSVSVRGLGRLHLVETFRSKLDEPNGPEALCGHFGDDRFFSEPDLALFRLTEGRFPRNRIDRLYLSPLSDEMHFRASGYGANPYRIRSVVGETRELDMLSGAKQAVDLGLYDRYCSEAPANNVRACNAAFETAMSTPLQDFRLAETGQFIPAFQVASARSDWSHLVETFEQVLPEDTCPGDSGGPVHVMTDDGTWHIAAITSRSLHIESGTNECTGAGSIYVRLGAPSIQTWISDMLTAERCTVVREMDEEGSTTLLVEDCTD